MHNIKTSLANSLDPLQFAYRPNRSTDDAISSTLHLALTHLENKDSYVRILFIEFSSAFNKIISQQLINKVSLLGLNNSLCNWILDFLTGRPQSVRVGQNTSSTTTLSTGALQGCVLSLLLFTLLTRDCTAKFSSNHIIKFADDTSVVGLISNNDEIKSNQIKSLLLSHHHSTSALVSEILMSVLQTVQKNNKKFTYGQTVQKKQQTIYIWTDSAKKKKNYLHMVRQCKKLHWSIYSAPDSAKKTTAIYIWADSAKKQQTIYIWADSAKKQQTIYIWTDSAKKQQQFTYGQ